MAVIIRVYAIAADGREFRRPVWIESYDVDAVATGRSYFDATGAVINGFWGGVIRLTIHRDLALRFATHAEALTAWNTPSTRRPLRPDGKPNKPLTALTVEIEPS